MKNSFRSVSLIGIIVILAAAFGGVTPAKANTAVFINEIHYDNTGTDAGEAIEIAGPAGTYLSGWSIVLYNGSGGAPYNTKTLDEVIVDSGDGYGFVVLNYPENGIQNGGPDGLTLIDNDGKVVQFLSYEGTFMAVGGPADGQTSVDIGVSEPYDTLVGNSLQLTGTGLHYEDFTWVAAAADTFGIVNTGQVFVEGQPSLPDIVINEVDADQVSTDSAEFVELYDGGVGNMSLDELVLVLFNGSDDASYLSFDLDGETTNAAGYFVLCGDAGNVANCDLDVSPNTNLIQNGADAVALILGDAADFPNDTPLTTDNLVDAIVYDTDDSDDADLLVLLNAGQPQVDEDELGDKDNHSNQRCPNGSGGVRNTDTYAQFSPTPGIANLCPAPPPPPAEDPVINEFVFNHTGSDTHEFIEIFGTPSFDYSSFTLLEIEGDSSGPGKIDGVFPLGSTNASGYWFAGFFGNVIENGSVSVLLVEGFSESAGADLDTDNDGVLDSTPWTRIVDGVAVSDGGSSDQAYAAVTLLRGYDGNSYTVGGASRIPNGTDTDTPGDWMRNDFDGIGLPGFVGTQEIGEAFNTPGIVNEAITVTVDNFGACTDPASFIHYIQGAGDVSPELGNIRVIEGVVVGDFEESDELSGFFLQEEDGEKDAFLETSEGIFVYNNGFGTGVSEGDIVRVLGTITEYYGMTELTSVIDLSVCSSGADVTAAQVMLPVSSMSEWETVEGMLVRMPQELFVTENYTLGRYGEVDLAVDGRLFNPTHLTTPGAAANAQQALNDRSRIQLDDGSRLSNKVPIPPYFAIDGSLRAGDSTSGIMGVLAYDHDFYEIHPVQPVNFVRENDRLVVPNVGGDITVASFNVLNYFTTIDDSGPICGPPGVMDCRGADTADEFSRQRDKIIAALAEMDADVVGLIEIENHPEDAAMQDLVQGLNDVLGSGTYDYVATGPIGTDAIKVGFIYKPAYVMPVGDYAVLDSSVDLTFIDTKNRPALAVTFVDNDHGTFTAVVNHLKSKGSDCNDLGDPDIGDGQGNCNLTRTSAAIALANWLATNPTGSGDPDFLIIGDLNAYAQEDPITSLETMGYTDLLEGYHGLDAYSYVFFGQAGYLDHALANPMMQVQVTGVEPWHINADEPSALDYNEYNQSSLYVDDAYRASDHDPVLVGLEMNGSPICREAAASVELLWPANHKFVVEEIIGIVDPEGDPYVITIDSIFQDEPVDENGDGSTAPDAIIGDDGTFELRAERVGDGNGRVYHISFNAVDSFGGSCRGTVQVGVPHDSGKKAEPPVDDGAFNDSTIEPKAMIVPEPTKEPSDKDKKDK